MIVVVVSCRNYYYENIITIALQLVTIYTHNYAICGIYNPKLSKAQMS